MSMKIDQIRMRDPFVLESAPGAYVLFGTTDENLWGGPGTGFDCFTSSDLENWDGPIAAFRPPAGFWGETQFWAPEVHKYGERFYMLATFATATASPKIRGTAVLVSDSPTGPFVPHSDGPVTPTDVPCLDGTLYVENGQPWIVYSRGAEGIPGGAPGIADGEMYARRLSPDLSEGVGDAVLLFTSKSAKWSKPLTLPPGVEPKPELNLAKDPHFTDGAFLVKAESGELLMLWSAFGEAGYAMGVAKSASGSILGPWVQSDEPFWARNGGHGMILRASTGKDYMVFHWPNDTPAERARLVEIAISGEGFSLDETPTFGQ